MRHHRRTIGPCFGARHKQHRTPFRIAIAPGANHHRPGDGGDTHRGLGLSAPAAGIEIELTSSDRAAASVPPVITIGSGATAGTFRITTALVAAPVNVILTATHATTSKTATLSVMPPAGNYIASLGVVPAFIVGGTTATATVTLAFPSGDNGGSEVRLTSSAPAVLIVPSVGNVHRNATTATFTVTTVAIQEPVAATLTATYGGVVQRAQVVVARENAVTLAGLSVTPDRVVGGTTASGRVTLTAPAPFGGAVVAIDAKRRNIVTVPPTVMVPEGATSAVFPIGTEAVHGQKERALELVATYNNTTATAPLTVTPPPATATASRQRPAVLCASMALAPCLTRTALEIATSTSTLYDRQYNLYTPELSLLAETIASPTTAPPIAYEYIWFAGQPLAQVNVAANQIHYYFNDHLGTPILQTDATARIVWQVEYEPYGDVYAVRRGEEKHQPLRFPGQETGSNGDLSYNIYRWYRAGWGRYPQADPIFDGDTHAYSYASANPVDAIDPLGLYTVNNKIKLKPTMTPEAFCGSPIACTNVFAYVHCDCKCNDDTGSIFAEDVTLVLSGEMAVKTGPYQTLKKKPVDPTVINYKSAIAHEYYYHIYPALTAVDGLLKQLESTPFASVKECVAGCNNISAQVIHLFMQTLKVTQAVENAK